MREAFAKGLGVDEDKITVDVDAGTVSVDMGDATADKVALAAALEDTNKYSLTD